jgi:chromosome partitioning protein
MPALAYPDRMARVVAVSNLKGGSAKSTTAISLGAALAALGRRVLLVDVDAQGHLAEGFGIAAARLERDVSLALAEEATLADVLLPLRDGLDLAPANLALARLEPRLFGAHGRENRLRRALAPLADRYDEVLIDCPPSIGLYTVNAWRAAGEVLVPMAADFYSLVGATILAEELATFSRQMEHPLAVLGVVPTRFDRRTRNAAAAVEGARAQLPGVRFFEPIPEAVAVREAAAAGVPVREYAPGSPVAAAYDRLAQEVLDAAP